jgi:hypothetical protein
MQHLKDPGCCSFLEELFLSLEIQTDVAQRLGFYSKNKRFAMKWQVILAQWLQPWEMKTNSDKAGCKPRLTN